GQHRLLAIILAGVPVPLIVIDGVDSEAFKTLDQGKNRSAADTLGVANVRGSRTMASALGWLHRYEVGSIASRAMRASNKTILEVLAEHPGVVASYEFVRERYRKGMFPPGPFVFLHYVCSGRHKSEAQTFFDQVLTGTGIAPGTPQHLLTTRMRSMAKITGRTQ